MVPEMYAKARGEKKAEIAQDPSAHASSPKLMALDGAHYSLQFISWIMRMRELLFHHWFHGATQQKKIFLKRSTGLLQFLGYENGLR